jgi:HAD superfamily hydrolase (TIGR01509 family)
MNLQALLFDCDGVLAETERDGHRVAYNRAMEALGIEVRWQADEYAELVLISGGKERLKYYFEKDRARFPEDKFGPELIQRIYLEKTAIFKEMANRGDLPPRPGIGRIAAEAREAGVLLFVCSTSHKESVETLLKKNYGEDVFSWFTELFCGDVVAKKKPAPDIYLLAKDKYGLDPARCCVIEDSRNGLLAAKAAGMRCLITKSYYTQDEDFSEADGVVSSLGNPGGEEAVIYGGRLERGLRYVSLKDIRGF